MDYTKNQHVLSQWVLRNFRSDDTALYAKEKQRVWCHTVYMTPEKEKCSPHATSAYIQCGSIEKLLSSY